MNADELKDYHHIIDLFTQADSLADRAGFSESPLKQPAIVLADMNTGFRYPISYRDEAFKQLEGEVIRRNLGFQPRINALETLLHRITAGRRELSETSRRALIVCAGLYVVGTRIYAVNGATAPTIS